MPKLVISLPDAGEVIHELVEAKVSVGRLDDNTIQIEDASISSHHAELTRKGEHYVIKDLGSTNGSRLNRQPLTGEETLKPGDRLRFGKVDAIYETNEAKGPRPLPQEEEKAAAPAASSQKPAGFGNASPFTRRSRKQSPIGIAAILVAVIGLGAAAYTVYTVTLAVAPTL